MKFYPQDYLYDTRILTLEERGAWMDLLCFMWNAPLRGSLTSHPQQLAQMIGVDWNTLNVLIDSFEKKGVCNVSRSSNGDVTLLSRRMSRDGHALKLNADRQERFRIASRLRQLRARQKHSNDLVTVKKLEAKKLEAIKDLKTTTYVSPTGDTPKPLTDIQKIVGVWKITSGYQKGDRAWDRLNYSRCSRSAKQLLEFFGDWKKAGDCIQDVYEKLNAKGLTVTLETVCRHAADWKKDKQEVSG